MSEIINDTYEQEVQRLADYSWNQLDEAWIKATPLFKFCNEDGDIPDECGCLTQVRCGMRPAATPELTEAIRADERIPRNTEQIYINGWNRKNRDERVELLRVFAEWQRRIDKEIRDK